MGAPAGAISKQDSQLGRDRSLDRLDPLVCMNMFLFVAKKVLIAGVQHELFSRAGMAIA